MTTGDDNTTMRTTVAAIVVLYRPDDKIYGLHAKLLAECSKVYYIDNASDWTQLALTEGEKTHLLHSGWNIGLAKAYNLAIQQAQTDGIDWLVFFDQDTSVFSGFAEGLLEAEAALRKKTGNCRFLLALRRAELECRQDCLDMTIGSGLAGRVADLTALGMFDERRFVDGVDEEFCLRARRNGYAIFPTQAPWISHSIGVVDSRQLLHLKIKVYTYSATRVAYQTNHTLLLAREYFGCYPAFIFKKLAWQLYHIALMVLFSPHPLQTLAGVWRGVAAVRRPCALFDWDASQVSSPRTQPGERP